MWREDGACEELSPVTWLVGDAQRKLVVGEERAHGLKAASLGPSAPQSWSRRKATWVEGLWGLSPGIGHLVSCGALWWAERGLQARWGARGSGGGGGGAHVV